MCGNMYVHIGNLIPLTMSKTSTALMPAPKQPSVAPHPAPPLHIVALTEAVRAASDSDRVIRIRADHSAKSTICFTASWLATSVVYGSNMLKIERRVYVETKLDEAGHYVVHFMAKVFDENAVTHTYPTGDVATIAKDVLRYLRMGHLNDA